MVQEDDSFVEMPATFTVACWTKLDNFAFFSSFVGNGMDTGDDECGFFLYNYGWVDESGKDFGLAIRTETGMNHVETPNIYETNTWYHLAATYDGTNVIIYVNGSLAVGPTDVGGPLWWVSQTSGNYPERFAIGVWLDPGYDLWVDGAIDDVRYYSRALDASEVKALMTAAAYYPFACGPVPKHGAMIKAVSQVPQWSPGDSAASHEVYFGESFEQVAAATPGDTNVFAGRLAARMLTVGTAGGPYPQGLVPGTTYYWRVDEVNDVHPGSPWKGEVWSFSVQPLTAWKPYPPDGMKHVDPNQDLRWENGLGAMFHTVYLGRSFDEVSMATTGGAMTANSSHDPGPLSLDTTYYWRVDEVNVANPDGLWKGRLWSFTTADFVVIDDFEIYTNDSPNRLFQSWIGGLGYSIDPYFPSGYGGNGTGAALGHNIWNSQSAYYGGSIAEVKDVHGGYQAMPLYYDNTVAPYYSEAERTWKTAQNWTVNGVTDLTLYVRGEPGNDPAPLYVAIEDSAGRVGIVTHPNGAIVTAKGWAEWTIPLSDFANAGVTLTAVKKMSIGVGGRNASTAGGTGIVYIDDIRLTKPLAGEDIATH